MARKILTLQKEAGIDAYPASPELSAFLRTVRETGRKEEKEPKKRAIPLTPPTAPSPVAYPPASLAGLAEEIAACRRCPRRQHCERPLFLEGPGKEGAVLIVADTPAPGDAQQGQPMSGEAGVLLDKMLAAIGMDREAVHLTYLAKCPAPEPPEPAVREACLPFLLRELAALRPRLICAMGALAAQTLLHSPKPLSQLRGRFHDWKGTPLLPTFPPDFLLKNPELKKAAWHDLQLIQKLCAGK